MRLSKLPLIATVAIIGSSLSLPVSAQTVGGSSLGNPSSGGSTTGGFDTGSSTGSFGTGNDSSIGTGSAFDSGADSSFGGAEGGLDSTTAPNSGSGIDTGASTGGAATGSQIDIGGADAASSDTTTLRATEGSSTIGEVNAGAFARSGNAGTSGATSLGGEEDAMSSSGSDFSYTAGRGTAADFRIPSPPVGIDLGSIRAGLRNAPSATPKPNGD